MKSLKVHVQGNVRQAVSWMLFNNFEGDCRRVHVPYGDHSEPKLQVESHICHAFPYPLYKNQGQKKRFLLADFIIDPKF